MKLSSKRLTVDASYDSFFDFANDQTWTDGLPIVPPTEDRVVNMLQGTQRDPEELVAIIPPRNGKATVEKIAINAVMAGCKPEYMPILVTAVETMARRELNLLHIQTTTSPVAPLTIVHGPITERVGMKCGTDVLGPGNRANATIGRAIRLVLINIGGGISDVTDKATHGQPGKYTFCIAEHWRENPWSPLHVDQGFDASASAVTIFPVIGTEELAVSGSVTQPEPLLLYVANTMKRWASHLITVAPGPLLVLLAVGHARLSFARYGWDKPAIQKFLFEHARIEPESLPDELLVRRFNSGKNPTYVDGMICPVRRPEDIHIVVAGGHEAHHIQVLPGSPEWGMLTQSIPEHQR